jgi:hypothetical protein
VLTGDLVICEDDLAFALVAANHKPFGGDVEGSARKEPRSGNQSESDGSGGESYNWKCVDGFLAPAEVGGRASRGTCVLHADRTAANPAESITTLIDFAACWAFHGAVLGFQFSVFSNPSPDRKFSKAN